MPSGAPPDLNADVCIVGGSLVGLWTALRLARRGVDVVLLERGTLRSVRRLGLLTPGLSVWSAAVCAIGSKATARATFDLSLEAVAQAIMELESLGLPRAGRGLLRVGGAHEAGALDAEDAARDLLGLPDLRRWQGPEIAATIASPRYCGATYEPHALLFETVELTQALAAAARAAGGRILEQTPALAADLDGVRKYVQTPAGRVRADHVILCAGRGAAAVAPWLARSLGRQHWVTGGFAVRAARPDFSGLVAEPGRLGARFAPRDGELSFEAPTASRVRGEVGAAVTLRRRAKAIYPELGRALSERADGFSQSSAPNGLPLIGQQRQGVWYATGLGANPLANAALAADVITAGIVERSQSFADLAAFQPQYAFGFAGRLATASSFWWLRLEDALAHGLTARAARQAAAAAASPVPPRAPVVAIRARLHGKIQRAVPRLRGGLRVAPAGAGPHAASGQGPAHGSGHGPAHGGGSLAAGAMLHAETEGISEPLHEPARAGT